MNSQEEVTACLIFLHSTLLPQILSFPSTGRLAP